VVRTSSRAGSAELAAVGNRKAEALLRKTHGNWLIQLQPRGERRSASVPGLRQRVVTAIEATLSTDPQASLDTLVSALAADGKIDVTYLTDGKMTAVTDTSRMKPGHFGNTAMSPGTARPRPSRVDIGPDAFRTVSDLYATVMHEWQHVLQFRRPTSASEPADEMEARLWEVEHMRETGTERSPSNTITLRNQLRIWWRQLTPEEQAAFESRYEEALETIEEAQLRQQTGRVR
jgi:hypothetical protein